MPRYRENPLVIPFSMFCAGISRNSEHHHLTLSNGQVMTDKSYLELCDNNFINIAYDTWYDIHYDMVPQDDGTLYIPPSPGIGFNGFRANIAHNGEIFQSFLDLCRISLYSYNHASVYGSYDKINSYLQLLVGPFQCNDYQNFKWKNLEQYICLPPNSHAAWYLFTKEGFKINENIFFICKANYSIIF